ncbi:GIY-YIG nuclease family protein [Mycobacterium sp. 360MFTsu5.1]|uniref:GIY-YIG nuclease family protein n=1 Tax=Mycobacterium sp. 360MFTsu5.1 TaxID=1172186 RepID=UPI003369E336
MLGGDGRQLHSSIPLRRIAVAARRPFKRRIAEIQPEDCIGYEHGNRTIELQRHKQFAHLRVSGEWFELATDLVRHVNTLAVA